MRSSFFVVSEVHPAAQSPEVVGLEHHLAVGFSVMMVLDVALG